MAQSDYNEIMIKNSLLQIEALDVPNLESGVFSRLDQEIKPSGVLYKKPLTVVAYTLIAIVLMTGSVMAVTNSSFADLLEKLNPSFGQILEPVQQISIDQGIKMEVVGAASYDNMAMAYISLQDLEGDRINEETGFYEHIRVKGCDSFSLAMADFDPETKTATYLVEATTSQGFGDQLIFETKRIYYGIDNLLKYPAGIDFSDLAKPETVEIKADQIFRGGYSGLEEPVIFGTGGSILKPFATELIFPEIDFLRITNLGIIDGKLHVQYLLNREQEQNRLCLYLLNEAQEPIYEQQSIGFVVDENGSIQDNPEAGQCIEELVFEIKDADLASYQLMLDYSKMASLEGLWTVTADVISDYKPLVIEDSFEVSGFLFESISVNPFGINCAGRILADDSDTDAIYESEVVIFMGSQEQVIEARSASYNWEAQTFEMRFQGEEPIKVDKITQIKINEIVIPIK